jgi:4-hydroxyacetophenone monooxygenase
VPDRDVIMADVRTGSVAASPSPFVAATARIDATDAELRAALADAEVPPLLPALAYLTGDLTLLREDLRVDPLLVGMPQGGLTDEQQAAARDLAFEVLVAHRDAGCPAAPAPSDDDLLRILEHTVGGGDMVEYLPLLEEELAYRGEDRRAPTWHVADIAPGVAPSVVIIGAGMSGLLAAHRLQQAGVGFVIVDKNDEVGGTWWENSYPGCRVDNPNHNYSYSFAQRHDWPFHYSTQGVLRDYFRDCADVFGLRPHIRLGTEVEALTWSDDDAVWTVECRSADGARSTLRADIVVSAVGQLNRPSFPDIAGRDTFAGPSFHSARWEHGVELTGKRVAVIGTGASALQFVPEIAPVAGELTVFQRTPPWLAPTPDYHDEVAPGLRWLYAHVPTYSELNRFAIFWRMGDGALDAVRVDESWHSDGGSVSELNEMTRQLLTEYLRAEFADRPDLLEHVVPDYPVGAKRGLRDNGVWAATLKRDDVHLVTDPIVRITERGVVTADTEGDEREHEIDVLIYGTGFQASKFLTPMRVTGAGGVDLHEQWHGDARAHLGVTVAGFPNLFLLYGPNTNIVINGSIVYFSECGVRLAVELVGEMLRRGARAVDVRREVFDDYNARIDEGNRSMAWGRSTVNSWYKNEHGHVAQNWPFTLLEYWQRTRRPDPDEYDFIV